MKKRVYKFIVSCISCFCLVIGFSISASAVVEDVLVAGAIEGALAASGIGITADGINTLNSNHVWYNDVIKITESEQDTWYETVTDGKIKWVSNYMISQGISYDKVTFDTDISSQLNYFTTRIVNDYQLDDDTTGTLFQYSGFQDTTGNIFPYVYSIFNYNVGPVVYIPISSEGSSVAGPVNSRLLVNSNLAQSVDTISYNGSVIHQGTTNPGATVPVPFQAVYSVNRTSGEIFAGWKLLNDSYISSQFPTSDYLDTSDVVNISVLFDTDTIDTSLNTGYGYYYLIPSSYKPASITSDGEYSGSVVEDVFDAITDGAGLDVIIETGTEDYLNPPVPPVPPTPVPTDTPLGEVPYEDFLDTFGQSVYGKLDTISDAVDTAGQSITDALSDVEDAIDTAGQSVVDSVEESTGILEDAIEAVEAKVDELVDSIADVIEEIMSHPLDLFSAWLDRLPEIPAIKDIFDGIKRHVGIWHYVVEWLGCIGTFLGFFIGLFGDVAYCMVVPIYACVAGAICLAFYKRFAR